MSESNNQDNTSKRTNNPENDDTFYINEDVDRYATIEFSEDDLKRIRRPNPQPMDEDYFAEENKVGDLETNDYVKKEDTSDEETVIQKPSQVDDVNLQADQTQSMGKDLEIKNANSPDKSVTLEENQAKKGKNSSRDSINHDKDDIEVAIFNLKENDSKDHLIETSTLHQEPQPKIQTDNRIHKRNSSNETTKDSFYSELGQTMELDESDSQEIYDKTHSSSRLEETLDIEIDEELYQRHDFQEELEAPTEDKNPFAYHSIEEQLRIEQESKRQTDEPPNVFQRVIKTVFTPRGNRTKVEAETVEDEEIVEPVEVEENLVEAKSESAEIEADTIEEIKKRETERLDAKESDGRVVAVSPSVIEEYELDSANENEGEIELKSSPERMESEKLIKKDDKQTEGVNSNEEEIDRQSEPAASQEDNSMWEKAKANSSETWHKVSDQSSKLWNTASHSIKGWFDGKDDKAQSELTDSELDSEEIVEVETTEAASSSRPSLERPPKEEELVESSLLEEDDLDNNLDQDTDNKLDEEKTYTLKEILLDERQTDEFNESEEPDELTDLEADGSVVELDEDSSKKLADQVSQRTSKFSQPILTDAVLETTLGNQEDLTQTKTLEQQTGQSFVSGAAWLSAGKILSRIIGVLYIIPWATWLGTQYSTAATLYSVGYKQYSLLLAIATAGFPSAVAKQMAFFNSKREFNVADKLFKYSLLIMAITGIVTSTLLFIFAPGLAAISATDDPQAATLVIRTLAPALLILPVMSLIRGYFQGFNDMIPTAVSEVIEQIIRVIYILAATYIIMVVMQGSVVQAVAHSTFAAFIGAVGSLIYLVIVYLRFLPTIKKLREESLNTLDVNFKESIRLMLYDSFPFILLGSGIIIAQNIDTFTFRQIMIRTSVLLTSEISDLFGAMSLDVDKLIMIIVALAVALATSSIPAVSAKFAEGDDTKTGDLVKNILLVFTFVMLPASVGMATIANNIYPFFYPEGHPLGPSLLVTGSIMSIALGAYTVLSAVLQSMNYRRQAVKYLVVGLFLKLLLQYPMVGLFHAHGAMIATTIAFAAISVLMTIKILRTITIRDPFFVADLIRIVIGTVVMGFGASGWNAALNLLFGPVGRGLTLVKILLVVIFAIFIYTAVMALFGMLSIVIGDYRSDLQERFSLNK